MYLLNVIFISSLISLCLSNVAELWTRERCIEELGCFYAGKPFFDILERPISLLPDEREEIDTKFYLFTRKNRLPENPYRNFDSSMNDFFASSGFNPKLNTKFVIGGFMSRFGAPWKMPMIELLLRVEDCNVFLIDWHGGDGPFYEQAVANTRVVGAEIAQLLKTIKEKTGINYDSVHLIGHSLGSHVAGYVGKILGKVGRITALDPAGPYFTNVDPIVRLDRGDAKFVDAIHTNAAPSRFQGFGLVDSIAHIDFWPNGGHLQPGCPNMGSSIVSFLSHPSFNYEGLHEIECNHDRAIHLFLSSINYPECELYGVECESWDDYTDGICELRTGNHAKTFLLGIHADRFAKYINNNTSINVFLKTKDAEPYCL